MSEFWSGFIHPGFFRDNLIVGCEAGLIKLFVRLVFVNFHGGPFNLESKKILRLPSLNFGMFTWSGN